MVAHRNMAQEAVPQVFGRDEYRAHMIAKYGTPSERIRWEQKEATPELRQKYAFSPITPKNVHTSVPLTTFATDYARDRNTFLIEAICPSITVDKLTGIYYRFDTPEGYRIEDVDEDNYAPGRGGGRPKRLELEIDASIFECDQHALSEDVPITAEKNADFNLKIKVTQMLTGNLQLRRAKRAFTDLTTGANWPTNNTDTCTNVCGGKWNAGDSASKFIQQSINAVVETIMQETYNSVDPANIWMVINPTAARALMESKEIRDWVKQQAGAEQIVQGKPPFKGNAHRYGLPPTLFGVNVLVYPTRILTSQKGASDTSVYLIDDDALFLNVEPPSIQTMNTYTCFMFEPFRTEDHEIAAEHISSVQVLHNYDQKFTAAASGFLLTDIYT